MGPLKLGGKTLLLDVKGLLENRNDNAVALEVSVGFSLPGFNFWEEVLFCFEPSLTFNLTDPPFVN